VLAFLSIGILGINYLYASNSARKAWKIQRNAAYAPKVSIIIPTFNERQVIEYKLRNLAKINYSSSLIQMVFVDSQSTDGTLDSIQQFATSHPEISVVVLEDSTRKGKTSALNQALKTCAGDVVIVSDADCFWPPSILSDSLSYLADPEVGAVSGPKKLLNSDDSWVTRGEASYLESMNLMRLGDSKGSSTIFFEGGFGAYKKEAVEAFDPYNTGSDDCGTVIRVLEKGLRTLMIPEAAFFTAFPRSLKEKLEMKTRRSIQLVQLFRRYAELILKKKIQIARGTIIRSLFMFLVAPVLFLLLMICTFYLITIFPIALALFLVMFIPKLGRYLIEGMLSYLILIYSLLAVLLKRNFVVWKKPNDRDWVNEDTLLKNGLI